MGWRPIIYMDNCSETHTYEIVLTVCHKLKQIQPKHIPLLDSS